MRPHKKNLADKLRKTEISQKQKSAKDGNQPKKVSVRPDKTDLANKLGKTEISQRKFR
jgi:hypothetical protein